MAVCSAAIAAAYTFMVGIHISAERAFAILIGMRLHFSNSFSADTAFLPVAGVVLAIPQAARNTFVVRVDCVADRAAAILISAGVIGIGISADRTAAILIGMRLCLPHPLPADTTGFPMGSFIAAIPTICNTLVVRIDRFADRAAAVLKLASVVGIDFVAYPAAAVFIGMCLCLPHPFFADTTLLPVAGVIPAIPTVHNTFVVRVDRIADRAAAILISTGVVGVNLVADRAVAVFISMRLRFSHLFATDTAVFPVGSFTNAIPIPRNAFVVGVSKSADRAAAVFIGMRLHLSYPHIADTAVFPMAGVI